MPFKTSDKISMLNAYNTPVLEFHSNLELVNKKTGELYYLKKRKYLNLTFTFKVDSQEKLKELTVRGSVHTFSNKGLHNANIMTFKTFTQVLDTYTSLFGINLSKCRLLPFEYGTNIYLNDFGNYEMDDIISNSICLKRKMFNSNRGYTSSFVTGTIKNEVRNKIYSKSILQPQYCENTLRIEDQYKKSRGLEKHAIYVSDLYNKKAHIGLLEKFTNNLKNWVIYDFTMTIPKRSKYFKEAQEMRTKRYWENLIKDCSTNKQYETKYNEKVAHLNKLSKRYGSNLKEILIEYIVSQEIKSLELVSF